MHRTNQHQAQGRVLNMAIDISHNTAQASKTLRVGLRRDNGMLPSLQVNLQAHGLSRGLGLGQCVQCRYRNSLPKANGLDHDLYGATAG